MSDDYKAVLSDLVNESHYDYEEALLCLLWDQSKYNKIYKFLQTLMSKSVWHSETGSLDTLFNHVQGNCGVPIENIAYNLNNSAKSHPKLREIIEALIQYC